MQSCHLAAHKSSESFAIQEEEKEGDGEYVDWKVDVQRLTKEMPRKKTTDMWSIFSSSFVLPLDGCSPLENRKRREQFASLWRENCFRQSNVNTEGKTESSPDQTRQVTQASSPVSPLPFLASLTLWQVRSYIQVEICSQKASRDLLQETTAQVRASVPLYPLKLIC